MTVWIVAIWFVVFIVLVVAFRLLPKKVPVDYKQLAREAIANDFPEFNVSNIFLRQGPNKDNNHLVHGIAIDKKAECFCLIEEGKPQVFEFKDLIECQLMVRGNQFSGAKISRLVKFIGTPVGDTIIEAYDRYGEPKKQPFKLLGIPLTNPDKPAPPKRNVFFKIVEQADASVNLRIIVQDLDAPFRTFALLETPEPDEEMFKAAQKEGEVWFELMSKVAKKADEEVEEPDVKALCIADELTKLLALKQEGLLTDDEYTRVKTRLVGA